MAAPARNSGTNFNAIGDVPFKYNMVFYADALDKTAFKCRFFLNQNPGFIFAKQLSMVTSHSSLKQAFNGSQAPQGLVTQIAKIEELIADAQALGIKIRAFNAHQTTSFDRPNAVALAKEFVAIETRFWALFPQGIN